MTDTRPPRMFKVMWQMPKQKVMTGNYQCADVKTLLRILERSEGVGRDTCKMLVVHEILPSGKVFEMLCIDEKDRVPVRPYIDPLPFEKDDDDEDTVLSLVEKVLKEVGEKADSKPHIKLSTTTPKSHVVAGRWHVYKAETEAG